MGGLFSSGEKKTKSESEPWKPQRGPLVEGFNKARPARDRALDANREITDYVADMTPGQTDILKRLSAFSSGMTGPSQQAMAAGQGRMGDLGQFVSNTQDLYGRATSDSTDAILGNAQKYADDPYLQGQIDSALGDVRKAFDLDRADINSGAVGTGNINSTRAGALEAMAADDAMDRAGDISSSMRGQAYQSGIDRAMAENARQIEQGGALNNNLIGSAGMGFDLLSGGYGLGSGALSDALGAETGFQSQAQSEIDGQREQTRSELDILKNYMSIVGGNYGGTTTQTTPTKSPFQNILGTGLSLLGTSFGGPIGAAAGKGIAGLFQRG